MRVKATHDPSGTAGQHLRLARGENARYKWGSKVPTSCLGIPHPPFCLEILVCQLVVRAGASDPLTGITLVPLPLKCRHQHIENIIMLPYDAMGPMATVLRALCHVDWVDPKWLIPTACVLGTPAAPYRTTIVVFNFVSIFPTRHELAIGHGEADAM